MQRVIALTGPKGSGKDTVAQLILELYPDYDVTMVAFADPIKKAVEHIFQLPIEGAELNNHQAYDKFKRSRLHFDLPGIGMQAIDTRHVVRELGMLMRSYDEKQFNEYVRSVVERQRAYPKSIVVVTDMRFDNEYMLLRSLNAKIVKIKRPSYHYDGHITERGFDDELVDKVLMNDGDLAYLRTRVKVVMDSLLQE